jgi:RNA polymerase sigma-70 factor (ECF subfamily)
LAALATDLRIALKFPSLRAQESMTRPTSGGESIAAVAPETKVDRGNELMLALQRGETAALRQIVALYNQKLFSFVLRMVGDAPASEDIVQETWLSLYERRASYTPTHRFSTWLFTIARRKALSELRRRKVRAMVRSLTTSDRDGETRQLEPAQGTFAQPDASADGALVSVIVERALARLTPQQREIVLLRDVEGFDNEEIARILEWAIRPGAVRKRVFDAREAFRRAMLELGYLEH